jgi:predicted phage tail protein
MLRKIKLYGKLAKFIGHRVLEADVATAAEAVRFLLANWPELEAHMSDQHYRVSIGTYDLTAGELHDPAGAAPISFVPVVAGAGATGRIIAAIALIAASFFFPAAAPAAAALTIGGSTFTAVGAAIFFAGVSLLLTGVAQLLTPTPSTSTDEGDPRKSFSFSGIQNTNRAGVPVPVVYGETLVGSVVISAGIDIVQVSA